MICPICKKPVEVGGVITIEVMDDGSLYYEHLTNQWDEFAQCMSNELLITAIFTKKKVCNDSK